MNCDDPGAPGSGCNTATGPIKQGPGEAAAIAHAQSSAVPTETPGSGIDIDYVPTSIVKPKVAPRPCWREPGTGFGPRDIEKIQLLCADQAHTAKPTTPGADLLSCKISGALPAIDGKGYHTFELESAGLRYENGPVVGDIPAQRQQAIHDSIRSGEYRYLTITTSVKGRKPYARRRTAAKNAFVK
jgi:hypothetical protein